MSLQNHTNKIPEPSKFPEQLVIAQIMVGQSLFMSDPTNDQTLNPFWARLEGEFCKARIEAALMKVRWVHFLGGFPANRPVP